MSRYCPLSSSLACLCPLASACARRSWKIWSWLWNLLHFTIDSGHWWQMAMSCYRLWSPSSTPICPQLPCARQRASCKSSMHHNIANLSTGPWPSSYVILGDTWLLRRYDLVRFRWSGCGPVMVWYTGLVIGRSGPVWSRRVWWMKVVYARSHVPWLRHVLRRTKLANHKTNDVIAACLFVTLTCAAFLQVCLRVSKGGESKLVPKADLFCGVQRTLSKGHGNESKSDHPVLPNLRLYIACT